MAAREPDRLGRLSLGLRGAARIGGPLGGGDGIGLWRTNKYNAELGKDHWPIGSFIVMEKNRTWTNRVVGETDELHFARKINPTTLQRDDAAGTLIHPKHIHKALRTYLGVADTPESQRFPFNNTAELPLFS